MSKLTMVMRCGIPKDKAENMQYTLIDENYKFLRVSGADLFKALKAGKYEVTNMGINKGKLVSTNGAIDKYTLVDANTGAIVGKPTAVVLNRVEANGKLLGYTMFTADGTLAEVNVPTAVKMHLAAGVANSKLRRTANGEIIQSINGHYPLRVLEVKKASNGKIDLDLVFLGSAIGNGKRVVRYAGIIVTAESAAEFSKLVNKLTSLNENLIAKVKETGAPATVEDTLGIKRTGTAGVYVVIPFDNVMKLAAKDSATIRNGTKTFMVACTDYDADGDESNITLSNTFKVLDKQEGTKKATESLKRYVETAYAKLKEVGLK